MAQKQQPTFALFLVRESKNPGGEYRSPNTKPDDGSFTLSKEDGEFGEKADDTAQDPNESDDHEVDNGGSGPGGGKETFSGDGDDYVNDDGADNPTVFSLKFIVVAVTAVFIVFEGTYLGYSLLTKGQRSNVKTVQKRSTEGSQTPILDPMLEVHRKKPGSANDLIGMKTKKSGGGHQREHHLSERKRSANDSSARESVKIAPIETPGIAAIHSLQQTSEVSRHSGEKSFNTPSKVSHSNASSALSNVNTTNEALHKQTVTITKLQEKTQSKLKKLYQKIGQLSGQIEALQTAKKEEEKTNASELKTKPASTKDSVSKLNAKVSDYQKQIKDLKGKVDWLNVLRSRLKDKLEKKTNVYPTWHVIGIGQQGSALVKGPNNEVQVLRKGETFFGEVVVSINGPDQEVKTSAGVIKP